jgi:hypothetical protein
VPKPQERKPQRVSIGVSRTDEAIESGAGPAQMGQPAGADPQDEGAGA